MQRYLLSIFGQAILVLLGVFILVFLMVRLTGDPTSVMLSREASAEQRAEFRERMGFNRPLPIQFVDFVTNAVRGDFGNSLHYRLPALGLVLERLPASLELAFIGLFMAVIIAVPLGLAGGTRPGSAPDVIGRTIGLLGQTMPAYWLALVMIIVFAVKFGWLPTSGRSGWDSVLMPAFTLALPTMGRLVRLTRSAVMEIMGDDYIRTARGKGLSNQTIFYRHVLRNAAIALISVVGVQFSYMLGGSVLIENVFSWPGLGKLAYESISNRDFPLVQAIAIFSSVVVIAVNLLVDLAYPLFDPRIGYE
ncbi:MAG: ABC transporter permease [Caldilineaceae bacterium]